MNCPAHISLGESHTIAKGISSSVAVLHAQHADAQKKHAKEARSHDQTKERIKAIETEHARAREIMEFEIREHNVTAEKLDRAEREHQKTRDILAAQRQDVSSMLLQMEALKVEMEAQRKAFVVNVNWAARCTELKVKFDSSRADTDKLYDQHMQTKAALEVASKARDEFKSKSAPLVEALAEAQA